MKQKRSVIAYSFLAQTSRGEGDLLQGLTPIFKPIAKSHANEKFQPEEFAAIIDSLYGIKVHHWAIEDLIPRLESAGIIYKVKITDEIEQYHYSEIQEEFNEVTEKDIKHVTEAFVAFSNPILEFHGLAIDSETLEDAFLNQLVDMDFISILLKPDRSKEDSKSNKTISLKKSKDQEEWENEISARSKIDVLAASFIIDTHKTKPKLYDLIMRVATGALLSEVILNIQDPEVDVSLDGLSIILDTPFLMSYLDLSSPELHGFAIEICDQLRAKGAKIAAFEHSVDELKDNLKAVIERTKYGQGSGQTSIRLRQRSFEVYAKSVLSNSELVLEKADIGLIKNPDTPHVYQYFSEENEKELESKLGFYRFPLAKQRDAKSIASVVRLRRGNSHQMRELSECRFLFVAENTSLVRNASEFCIRSKIYTERDIPPALSEKYLSGLLWVLYGGKGHELTKHLLLANCAAALETRSDIISRMHNFLSDSNEGKLELFESLMTTSRAGQYVMQATLGDSTLITENNVPEILEKVKTALIEKHHIQSLQEKDDLKQYYDNQLKAKESEIQTTAETYTQELSDKTTEIERLAEIVNAGEQKNIHLSHEVDRTRESYEQLEKSIADKALERKVLVSKQVNLLLDDAKKYKRSLKLRVSLLTALFLAIVSLICDFNEVNALINLVVLTLVTFVSILFVPDYLLSKYIDAKCKKYFEVRVNKLFVTDSELSDLNIDWFNLVITDREPSNIPGGD
ncbi:MAG TPA: hypothetical protein ENI26_01435 [Methylophaga aminisulfidivorans]|uniref:Uncharacterized protein n=3 Tax=root TaxID=1 RepID=A0A7C1W1G9_9GAMM|nr:hypothetical protein [Methylophaga aminisulfidivorans]